MKKTHYLIMLFLAVVALVSCTTIDPPGPGPSDNPIEQTKKTINKIDMTLDTVELEAITLDGTYTIEVSEDENLVYIKVLVKAITGYQFAENVEFWVNNQIVEKGITRMNDSTIEYQLKDPNWSDIY